MRISDVVLITKDTFRTNSLRTVLTIFAVVIGIASILFLVSLGNGLQAITVDRISTSNSLRLIQVSKGSSEILMLDDAAVAEFTAIENAATISPRRSITTSILFGDTGTDSVVHAIDVAHSDLEVSGIVAGETFAEGDTESAVLSSTLVSLLGAENSDEIVGEKLAYTLLVQDDDTGVTTEYEKTFTVKGVVDSTEDNFSYIPLASAADITPFEYQSVKILSATNESRETVQAAVQDLGYAAESPADTLREVNAVFTIVKAILGVFGVIALVVASIGMFNTMTISLLERTRDIGIMKSIGATNKNIMLIFLAEAILLGAIGGVIGILFGFGVGELVNYLIGFLASKLGGEAVRIFVVPWNITGWLILLSVLISLITGLYPAIRASRLNPLNALRYE